MNHYAMSDDKKHSIAFEKRATRDNFILSHKNFHITNIKNVFTSDHVGVYDNADGTINKNYLNEKGV